MKILLTFFIALFFINITEAQNVGIGTSTPQASAQLDVSSTTKGLLPPRMTSVQRDAIPSPVAGLQIWCIDCKQLQVYDGSVWTGVTGAVGTAGAATATVATSESRNNSAYGDLATTGPFVTVTIPASGMALVTITGSIKSSASNSLAYMGFAVSGATNLAALDAQALQNSTGVPVQGSATYLVTGLTPGSNMFTVKYRTGGISTFSNRSIIVIPLQ